MKLYKVKEVAEILGMAEQSIRNSISKGNINSIKVMHSTRITQNELNRLLGLRNNNNKEILFKVKLFDGELMVNLKQLYDLIDINGTNAMGMKIFYNDIEIRDEQEARNICISIMEGANKNDF